ncbi:MAG TPA: glycerol kinase GlpK [Polyangia bacterium]|nr:glycerol kinase GlpK [Polyangia bacterium]
MSRCVVAIDQGTTGTTVLVLDETLALRGRGYREFPQIYPQPGWVEHDPEEIWRSVAAALGEALAHARVSPDEIAAIGITNQRETTLLWDRATQKPLANAIVWQDRRTADRCAALRAAGHLERVRHKTGLVLDPYFSGTKLAWLLEHVPNLRPQASSGAACFGTVDSFLVARLCGGVHVTDVSNASRTLLFDLHTLDWDPELCALFGVQRECLPAVRGSAEVYGTTRGLGALGLPDGIPVAGMAGDQQAALFGQACFSPGEAKCTYGTGAFLLMNTGDRPVASTRGLLTTVAWRIGGEVAYALEGSAFIAGAMVQWLRDGLGIIEKAADIEALARSVPDSGGVVAVPALSGLGAPHWRPEARGLLTGLTRGTGRGHLARAVLEGIALQNYDILTAMQEDAGRRLTSLKVDGGASANDLLMQFQADVLGVEIVRPALIETTALGAAFLAGIGAGVWRGLDDARRAWREGWRFRPAMPQREVAQHLERWRAAVAKA